MPELPEVETVKRGLAELLPNHKITAIEFDWNNSFPNLPTDITNYLLGSSIIDIQRRAKMLIIKLDSGYSLVVHLKMTGQMVFVGKDRFGAGHPSNSLLGELPDKSTRIIFELINLSEQKLLSNKQTKSLYQKIQNDSRVWQRFELKPKEPSSARLYFNDQRKFGWMRLMPTTEISKMSLIKKLGPEPLDNSFTYDVFVSRLRRRFNSSIKAVLLDQTVLAGIGNIYADEALFLAKIHPSCKVKDISPVKLGRLYNAIINVLQLGITKGGSSDRNYIDAKGEKGRYLDFAKVFRREGQSCTRCGQSIIKIRVAGRGTHLCKQCQKLTKSIK